MTRSRILAIAVLVLATVAVVAVASMARHPGHHAAARRGGRRDPVFLTTPGWHANHTRRPPTPQAPVATAATIPLLDAAGAVPTRTIAALPATGLIEQVLVYGRAPRSWDHTYPARTLPVRLTDGVAQDRWEGAPRRPGSRIVVLARVRGVAVEVDVYFGTRRPGATLRASAQMELCRLRLPAT